MILTVQHTDHLKLQSNIMLTSINYSGTFLRKRGCIMPRIDDRAVDLWERDLYSLRMIGRELGVSAAGVKKFLNRRGIVTDGGPVLTVCDNPACGVEFRKHRSYKRARRRNFCCPECYHAVLSFPEYTEKRMWAGVARKVVLGCGFLLIPGMVVHYNDGKCGDNDPGNLIVFASQSDRMRWHRMGGVESGVIPLWPGNWRDL